MVERRTTTTKLEVTIYVLMIIAIVIGLSSALWVFYDNPFFESAFYLFDFMKRHRIDSIFSIPLFFAYLIILLTAFVIYELEIILERKPSFIPSEIVDHISKLSQAFFIDYKEKVRKISAYRLFVAFVCLFIVELLVVWQRFFDVVGIVGFDTPSYVYYGEYIDKYGILSALKLSKPLPSLMMYVIYFFLRDNFDIIGLVTPIIFGSLYIALAAISSYLATKDFRLSFYVGLTAPLSLLFIRVSYDLYGQLIADALLFIALLFFSKIFMNESRRSVIKDSIFLSIIIIVLYLTHFWTAILVALFLFLAIILSLINSYIKYRTTTYSTMYILKLLLILSILSTLFLVYDIDAIYWLLNLVGKEFHFFSLPPGWLYHPSVENPLLWLLSVFGTIALLKRNRKFGILSTLWVLYITSFVIILGYMQVYRIYLLYPTPLFTGAGLDFLHENIHKKSAIKIFSKYKILIPSRRRLFTLLFISLIFSLLLGETISRAYYPALSYRPRDAVIEQLTWIREKYGFENQSILVVISYNMLKASYYWPIMIVGSNIYLGSLRDLVEDKKDFLGKRFDDWKTRDIIITNETYPIGPIERVLSKELSPGIYKIKNITLLEDFFTRRYEHYYLMKELIKNTSSLFQDPPLVFQVIRNDIIEIITNLTYTEILINSTRDDAFALLEIPLNMSVPLRFLVIGYKAKLTHSIARMVIVSENQKILSLFLKSENRFIIDTFYFGRLNVTSVQIMIYVYYPTFTDIDSITIDFMALTK
ncbi:MAG: hypothetical protein J7L07_07535 [Candidatus Odinarchaeota archaeon]|nr:hypothetical protein [Candidatus Odinarchaeota archaeon]